MRFRETLQLGALIIIFLITWILSSNSFDVSKTARDIFGIDYEEKVEPTTPAPKIKCDLSRNCPVGNFALRIKSGAANVVGPSICFEGQTVLSHINNNVGPGLNFAVVNGETGTVDKVGFLNSKDGRKFLVHPLCGLFFTFMGFSFLFSNRHFKDLHYSKDSVLLSVVDYSGNSVNFSFLGNPSN
ncbi:hypothetical protein NL108_010876 [Boleophthalmus pectinirostris]|nr:hypothetical protein NL108_010876 [Boleophthalmus pectinirostris]